MAGWSFISVPPSSGYQIFCSAHSSSFEQNGRAFLAAINLNSPGVRVVIEIINPSETLRQAIPGFHDTFRATQIFFVVTEATLPADYKDTQSFCACRRLIALTELLHRSRTKTLALDIEAYVKRDLSVFFKLYSSADFAVYLRPTSTSVADKALANGIYVDPTEAAAIDLMAAIVERILSCTPKPLLDQESIAYALADFAGRLKVADIQKAFLDFESNDPSYIWIKGRRKEKPVQRYLEYRQYLDNTIDTKHDACLVLPQEPGGTDDERTAYWLTASLYRKALSSSGTSVEIALCTTSMLEQGALSKLPHQTIFIPTGISCSVDGRVRQFDFVVPALEKLRSAVVTLSCMGHEVSLPNPNHQGVSDYLIKPCVAEVPAPLLSHNSRALVRSRNSRQQTKLSNFLNRVKAVAIRVFAQRLGPRMFKGKRIALVGNSRSLLEKPWGEEIDAHDIVIRFNLGYPFSVRKDIAPDEIPAERLAGIFEDARVFPPESHILLKPDTPRSISETLTNVIHTGSKTTIWVCATVDQRRQEIYSALFASALCIWPHPTTYANINRMLLNRRLRTLNARHFFKFKSAEVTPSSGLIMFEFLRSLDNYAALDLYGFDFFASGHQVRNNTLLHEKKRAFPHQGNFEGDYIRSHIKQNSRIQIKG